MHDEPRLYRDLAPWFHLLTAPADYAEEAALYTETLTRESRLPVREVLELGSGGGNNASHMKARFDLTLVDRSPAMLEVSRTLNPDCEHREGDMREVRLDRRFDAVFVHDAVAYLLTEEDLGRAMRTAWEHLRPGGVALFVPDCVRETFRSFTKQGGHDGEGRSLRYLEWVFDPDPDDTEFKTVFAYLLREGSDAVRMESDEHRMGLFPRDTWLRLLREVGFSARELPSTEDGPMFIGVREG